MSTKIKLYDEGDCVEVATWINDETDGFFVPTRQIGLVLEAELVEMDVDEGSGVHDKEEWLYRVVLPCGRITEVWDYEVRPVNAMGKEYNNISRQA